MGVRQSTYIEERGLARFPLAEYARCELADIVKTMRLKNYVVDDTFFTNEHGTVFMLSVFHGKYTLSLVQGDENFIDHNAEEPTFMTVRSIYDANVASRFTTKVICCDATKYINEYSQVVYDVDSCVMAFESLIAALDDDVVVVPGHKKKARVFCR